MKAKHYILLVLIGILLFLSGFFLGKGLTRKNPGETDEIIETIVDTIVYRAPIPQTERVEGSRRYTLPTYHFISGGFGGVARNIDSTDSTYYVTKGRSGEPGCMADSAVMELPVVQRHYSDSTYEAWVSGPIDPRLDSVRVYSPTAIITKREWKPPKHWHIGVTAGYGYGSKGFQPYIGVGLTYSILSF